MSASSQDKIRSAESSFEPQAGHNSTNEILILLEYQMKEIWLQYMRSLEQNGPNDLAEDLRKKYFEIYKNYKNKKDWLQILDGP